MLLDVFIIIFLQGYFKFFYSKSQEGETAWGPAIVSGFKHMYSMSSKVN